LAKYKLTILVNKLYSERVSEVKNNRYLTIRTLNPYWLEESMHSLWLMPCPQGRIKLEN